MVIQSWLPAFSLRGRRALTDNTRALDQLPHCGSLQHMLPLRSFASPSVAPNLTGYGRTGLASARQRSLPVSSRGLTAFQETPAPTNQDDEKLPWHIATISYSGNVALVS